MKMLRLFGEHYEMGCQHAGQALASRGALERLLEDRLAGWPRAQRELAAEYAEAVRSHAAPAARMLEGIADGFAIDAARLWAYVASGWVLERMGESAAALVGEGCTTWAARGADEGPILVKNRDYYRDHREVQVLCEATPARGHRWLAVGSVGSPGVFSSGMNERGLCVADTHVATRDLGPGAPRYAQMLDLLERCATVAEAVSLLARTQSAGGGTLVLTDASGALALCELAHGRMATHLGARDVVATNHFTTPALRRRQFRLASVHRASVNRRARVTAALRAGPIDTRGAERLMRLHGLPERALCRHAYPGRVGRYGTISSAMYLPRQGVVRLSDGRPCTVEFVCLRAGQDFWT